MNPPKATREDIMEQKLAQKKLVCKLVTET